MNSPSSADACATASKPEPHARAAYYQALASIFARDRVLSVASHDLRSPLNGIHSWIYVLESKVGSADPTVQRALAGLRAGVEQQVKIIEEVIDATRVQSKSLPLAKTHAALAAAGRARFWGDLQRIDALLGGREWLVGERLSLADCYAMVFWAWGYADEHPITELENFAGLAKRMLSRPTVRRVLERERNPLLAPAA